MPRKPSGAVVEHVGRDGTVYRSLRFTAYGKRRRVPLGAVDEDIAARKLRIALDQVAEGTWQPPSPVYPEAEPEGMPTFDEFAGQWWIRNEGQLSPNTKTDYRWRLAHLLSVFGATPLDRITFDQVERYIAGKLAEDKPLSARSINMTLTLMAAILEGAVERELITRNPAKGKSRRAREREPKRSYLDTAQQVQALLEAAGALDARARDDRKHVERRAMIATLAFAGLRVSELTGLRWRDVDLAAGWLHVSDSKTDAGRRRVKIRGALRDELVGVRARKGEMADSDAFVFPTSTGAEFTTNNVRKRVLAPAVELASKQLVAKGYAPLPDGLTPHSLRRTFASVLYAMLALRIYRQSMRRDDGEKERLRHLVAEGTLGGIGSAGDESRATTEPTVLA